MPTNLNDAATPRTTARTDATVAIAYWLFVLGALTVLRWPFNGVMSRIVDLQSEYAMVEQTSRFLLLLALVSICFSYYPPTDRPPPFAPSLFGLVATMLVAESDFMHEGPLGRPMLVALFGLWSLFELTRARVLAAALGLVAALGVLATSAVIDYLADHPGSGGPIRTIFEAIGLDSVNEEYLDLLGIAGVAFVVLALFWRCSFIQSCFRTGRLRLVAVVVGAGLVAVGNSLLHWPYEPSRSLQAGGAAVTIVGLASFAVGSRTWWATLRRANPDMFLALTLVAVVYVVVVPIVYRDWNARVITIVVWAPILLGGTAWWYSSIGRSTTDD